jgi:hypothetical protein
MRVLWSTYDSRRGVEPLLRLAVRDVISREEPPVPA